MDHTPLIDPIIFGIGRNGLTSCSKLVNSLSRLLCTIIEKVALGIITASHVQLLEQSTLALEYYSITSAPAADLSVFATISNKDDVPIDSPPPLSLYNLRSMRHSMNGWYVPLTRGVSAERPFPIANPTAKIATAAATPPTAIPAMTPPDRLLVEASAVSLESLVSSSANCPMSPGAVDSVATSWRAASNS